MKHPQQTNIRLDDQAKQDARTIAERHNLNGMAAAIRYALREVARQIEDNQPVRSVVRSDSTIAERKKQS